MIFIWYYFIRQDEAGHSHSNFSWNFGLLECNFGYCRRPISVLHMGNYKWNNLSSWFSSRGWSTFSPVVWNVNSFTFEIISDIYLLFYQGILINGQFPGPTIEAITNDNIVVNVINKLDDKFLITWLVIWSTISC